MKRLNSRGMASASKHVLLSALSYNLKKLMKFSRPKAKIVSNSLQKPNIKGRELWHFLSELIKGYTSVLSSPKLGLPKHYSEIIEA